MAKPVNAHYEDLLALLGSGLTGHTWPDHMLADIARLAAEVMPGGRAGHGGGQHPVPGRRAGA
ncbi:hypothetical protein [Amycolatopsis sp. CA-126428]|uniref:hypothetical protein n=1 Tax=Amycolatopsis sp. CA-126428 TaxID=2073158 RepID=UPI001E4D6982|nr:hypothetical protein [Amycolatopsis sp. CA-126428]